MGFIRTPLYSTLSSDEMDVRTTEDTRDADPDKYMTKLVKYVPAELVAPFVGIAALFSLAVDGKWEKWIVLAIMVVFAILTPLYFWKLSEDKPAADKPVWYFYVLSTVAFVVWALAINSEVRDATRLTKPLADAFLALGAFAIPFIDWFLTKQKPK